MVDDPLTAHAGELASWRTRLVELVRTRGYEHRPEPFELASGRLSHDFVDVKRALASGPDLALACRYLDSVARDAGVEYDAVGGLTMGADQLAYGMAVVTGCDWYVVRKQPKGRGTNKRVEGAAIAGRPVLVAEDAVSTGGSLLEAIAVVEAEGGRPVGVVTVVDRGDALAPQLAERGLWYAAALTYRDLGIEPIA